VSTEGNAFEDPQKIYACGGESRGIQRTQGPKVSKARNRRPGETIFPRSSHTYGNCSVWPELNEQFGDCLLAVAKPLFQRKGEEKGHKSKPRTSKQLINKTPGSITWGAGVTVHWEGTISDSTINTGEENRP